jgi:DNA-binding NtrC family response regulator
LIHGVIVYRPCPELKNCVGNYRSAKINLIVEDEPIIRETLAEFLMGEGFEVRTAGTAAEAIRVAQERDYDVGSATFSFPTAMA